ncbi:hypothetical protein ACWIGW_33110 [Nocardia brasiliensis]
MSSNTQAMTIDQSNGWLVYFLNSDIQQTHQGRAISSMKNGANLGGGNIATPPSPAGWTTVFRLWNRLRRSTFRVSPEFDATVPRPFPASS